MGSRILSRSFHVEPWGKGEDEDEEDESETEADTSADNAMDVDEQNERHEHDTQNGQPEPEEDSDEEDEDIEDPADVAMVPMADMLNARFESENVGLTFILLHYDCFIVSPLHFLHSSNSISFQLGQTLLRRKGS